MFNADSSEGILGEIKSVENLKLAAFCVNREKLDVLRGIVVL